MTEEDFLSELKDLCRAHGGVAASAQRIGVNRTHLFNVLAGRSSPGEKILSAVGMERRVVVDYVTRPKHLVDPVAMARAGFDEAHQAWHDVLFPVPDTPEAAALRKAEGIGAHQWPDDPDELE